MVAKKSVKKKSFVKRKISKNVAQGSRTEKILIENFVSLQKVMVDLSVNFENLNKKIEGLLNLFEDSARALVKKDLDFGKKDDKELLDKLNSILDQNKIIAKGLTLMHDTASNPNSSYSLAPNSGQDFGQRSKVFEEPSQPQRPQQRRPLPPQNQNLPFKVPELPGNKSFPVEEKNVW